MLNVLVRAQRTRRRHVGGGDATPGELALLRVPLASFSDGRDSRAGSARIGALPNAGGPRAAEPLRRRVPALRRGRRLAPAADDRAVAAATPCATPATRHVHEVSARRTASTASRRSAGTRSPSAATARICTSRACVSRARPVAVDRYTRAERGAGRDAQPRLLLQARGARRRPARAADHRRRRSPRAGSCAEGSAALLYLRNRGLELQRARHARGARRRGRARTTAAAPPASTGTATRGRSSCANRVFALLGYEIVEGAATEKRIVETRRVSFAPRPVEISR